MARVEAPPGASTAPSCLGPTRTYMRSRTVSRIIALPRMAAL
jgi:hypothetical protein